MQLPTPPEGWKFGRRVEGDYVYLCICTEDKSVMQESEVISLVQPNESFKQAVTMQAQRLIDRVPNKTDNLAELDDLENL